MAFADQVWYCNAGDQSTTGHYAVAKFVASTTYAAGQLVRQLTAPTVGNERVFVVIVAGTSSTEPAWTVTRGAKNTSGGVTFQECTGASAVNGDLINTANWTAMKALGTPTLGAIIQRNNGASYQICSTAGTLGASEPAFSNTAGTTTTEGTTTWTSLGVVGNFTGGQAPHARVTNVLGTNWFAAGNTAYVADNSVETQAAGFTISMVGTTATVGKFICHNHAGSYPPSAGDLTSGATISSGGNLSFAGSAGTYYWRGFTFRIGVGQSSNNTTNLGAGAAFTTYENCLLDVATSGSSAGILTNAGTIVFNNTTVKFAAIGQGIAIVTSQFIWQNSPVFAAGSTIPTTLFSINNASQASVVLEALDLSLFPGNIVAGTPINTFCNFMLKECKLNAAATVGVPLFSGTTIQNVRCDSAAAYKSARYAYEGTETTETTITRTGGAVDPAGHAQSRKIVTTANAQWLRPYKAEPYAIWNAVTGTPVNITVYGTVQSSALPYTDEVWLEVEYLGSSTSPLGSIVSTTKSNLLAGAVPVAVDSSSVWTGMLRQAEGPAPQTTVMTLNGTPSNVTMSNGNLTATRGSTAIGGVNSTSFDGPAIGNLGVKYYFEVTLQTSVTTGNSIGFMTPSGSVTNNPSVSGGAADKTGISLGSSSSIVYLPNGVSTGIDLGVAAVNDVIGVAIDMDNSLVWFRKNGGNWNNSGSANPATGVGGVQYVLRAGYAPYVAFAAGANSTDVMKANFGQVAFVGTPPSGFGSSGGSGVGSVGGWFAFKLTTAVTPGLAGYMHVRVRAAKPSATYYLDPKVVLT